MGNLYKVGDRYYDKGSHLGWGTVLAVSNRAKTIKGQILKVALDNPQYALDGSLVSILYVSNEDDITVPHGAVKVRHSRQPKLKFTHKKEAEDMAWATDSGNKTDVDFKIEEAWYATSNYNEGKTWLLHLKGQLLDEGQEIGEWTYTFPCGDGWYSTDGGETLQHQAGKTKFNKKSAAGIFIDSVIKCVPMDELEDWGDPLVAASWVGATFHMDEMRVDYGKLGQIDRTIVSEYLGKSGQAGGKAARNPLDIFSNEILAKLEVDAVEASSYDDFVSRAMGHKEIGDDPSLVVAVADTSVYNLLKKD